MVGYFEMIIGVESDIISNRDGIKESIILEQESDAMSELGQRIFRHRRDGLPIERDISTVWGYNQRHNFNEECFTGAARSDDSEGIAFGYVKVEVLKDLTGVE